jgi:hypothetical protein
MQWLLGHFPGIKLLGREVNHSAPASVEVKNEWSCISAPPICLSGVDVENFTFFTTQMIRTGASNIGASEKVDLYQFQYPLPSTVYKDIQCIEQV